MLRSSRVFVNESTTIRGCSNDTLNWTATRNADLVCSHTHTHTLTLDTEFTDSATGRVIVNLVI